MPASNSRRLATLMHESAVALIGDTLDFPTLGFHDFHGSNLDPGSLVEGLDLNGVYYHVWAAVKQTLDERHIRRIPRESLVKASLERFLFELATAMMLRVDGPHFTFVDPRKHDNTDSIVRNAQRIISLFQEKEVSKGKIVVSIPATAEGIQAAQILQSEHKINTNLYLVSGLLHAAACAEAGATTITVPVGRLLEWYEWRQGRRFKILSSHPGIETVQASVEYFKLHGIKTKVIGSEFRLLSEIVPLTELDAICIKRDQADGFHEYQITSSLTDPSPVALLRASQALYPPRPLSGRSGFMGTMSADTRACASYIIYSSLAVLKDRMDALEKIVAHEVQEQYNLLTLDLKTLFRMSDDVKTAKDSREAEEVCTDEELKDLWSTSRSTQYFEAFPDIFGHDSDEVF